MASNINTIVLNLIKTIILSLFTLFVSNKIGLCQINYYSQTININHDTTMPLMLNGKLDGKNTQIVKNYSIINFPDVKRVAQIELLDSIILENQGNQIVKDLQITSSENNLHSIDSIAKSSINTQCVNEWDSLYQIYNFVANKNYYYYVPEVESKEFKEVTKHFGVYSYGHCGSIANCASIIGQALTLSPQRLWIVTNSSHAISEIKLNNKWVYMDADEEVLVKNWDNETYASFGEAYEDLFLFYRTKVFSSALPYSSPQSVAYSVNRYLINPSHYFTATYPHSNNSCYPSDTIGNGGKELGYTLYPGEKLKLSWYKDATFNNHHLVNNPCYGMYGAFPDSTNLIHSLLNANHTYNVFSANDPIATKFHSYNNINYSYQNNTIKPQNTSQSSTYFIIHRELLFPIVSGSIVINYQLQSSTNQLNLFGSIDGINWTLIKSLNHLATVDTISLNGFIKPKVDYSKYKIYLKVEFQNFNNINDIQISKFDFSYNTQFSKFLYPSLYLGLNKLKIKSSSSNPNLQAKLYYTEHLENNPPTPPSYPIFPNNNSLIQNTNVRFTWEQLYQDTEGDSILEWHFQLSQFPDFRTPLANNFDYYSYGNEGNKSYFFTYIDSLTQRNTFFNHNQTYYWRIRVRDSKNTWSNWGPTWNFTVQAPQKVKNMHFELSTSNSNNVVLKWKKNPQDSITTDYLIAQNAYEQSVYYHPYQQINTYTSNTSQEFPINHNARYLRIFSMDNNTNICSPSNILGIPSQSNIQINDTLNFNTRIDNLQKPFPNYPSLERNYFLKFDTAFFKQISANVITPKQTGRTIVSICYTKNNDTIYKYQAIYIINKYYNVVHECTSYTKSISMSVPLSLPFTVRYKLNNILKTKVFNTLYDTIQIEYNSVIEILHAFKGTDTIKINKKYSNIVAPLDLSIIKENYICDSNKTKFQFYFTGSKPYRLFTLIDSNYHELNFPEDSNEVLLPSGNYHFLSAFDSRECTKQINNNFYLNYKSLSFNNLITTYNCNSNNTEAIFSINGNPPYKLAYMNNNILDSLSLAFNDSIKYFINGNYNFLTLADATGCTITLNTTHTFNYDTIDIQLSAPTYNCDSNKTMLHFDLHGNAPWTIQYTQNGTPMQINTSNNSFDYFFNNGVYQFLSVSDATLCVKNINQVFNFNYLPISINASTPTYNCDSNKTQIDFSFTGNAPFTLAYTQDAIPQSINTNNTQYAAFLTNGTYAFTSVTDATGCTASLNQTHTFNYDTIDIQLSALTYNCDSNKTMLHFDLHGNAPWTIQYTQNGTPMQINTSNNSFDYFFNNGVYQFLSVSDATLCVKNINQVFNFNYLPISINASTPTYNCDSNKTQIDFTFTGNAPFTLAYTQDAIPQSINTNNTQYAAFLTNGTYAFTSVTDATGCTASLNQTHTFNYDTIDIQLSAPTYNCDSNKTMLHFDLHGNAPWTIQYTQNGTPMQINTSNNSFDYFFNNGVYQFLSVSDATLCVKNINQVFNFNYLPISINASTPTYNCDSNKTQIDFTFTGNAPFTLAYTQDAIPQSINTNNTQYAAFLTNGTYAFTSVTDATGCTASLNQTHTFNYDTIDIQLSALTYNCDSNKTMLHFDLHGNAPWTIQYTQNGTPMQINTSNNSFDYFFNNGVYQFLSVSDATLCVKNINQVFNFNYLPISINASTPTYNCDSNKTQIDFTFTGNAPFTLAYTQDAIPQSINTNNTQYAAFLTNGTYAFTSVTDATGCTASLNQTHTFNYDTIDIQLSAPTYNCDSNKTMLHFDLHGNAPWTIQYTQNGTPMQINTSNNSFDYFFNNGVYQFLSVSDATLCVKNINQVFNFNYLPISINASTPTYNCDSNKTQIDFTFTGNAPFTLAYTQDAIPQSINTNNTQYAAFLTNGTYAFTSVTDATGCTASLNQTHTFNYDTIDIQLSAPTYNCDSNKTMLHFDLHGNAPWTIQYTQNGTPMQINTSNNSFDYFFNNGVYQFLSVSDATLCVKNINQVFNFNYLPISINASTPTYNCDSNKTQIDFSFQGNPPFSLAYTKDLVPLTINTNATTQTEYFTNGNYQFSTITDATGCVINLNQSHQFNFDTIDISLNTPVYNCDSNKTEIHFNFQGNAPWTIYYLYNGMNSQLTTSQSSYTELFPNGNYLFATVKDATNCYKQINQAFSFNYLPISASIIQQAYDCDSNKYKVSIHYTTGNFPWTVHYHQVGGSSFAKTFNGSLEHIWLDNGDWVIDYITDATACTKNLNTPLSINFAPIQATITSSSYDCDSNKAQIDFSLLGNSPWTIYYTNTVTNSNHTFVTSNSNASLWLGNGNYLFSSVTDVTGCSKSMYHVTTNFYSPLTFQKIGEQYNCDSNKVRMDYFVTGDASWTLTYKDLSNNTTYQNVSSIQTNSLYLPTGTWELISLTDTKCSIMLHDTLQINFPQLSAYLTDPVVNCDSAKMETNLVINSGLPPFKLVYNYAGQNNSLTTSLFNQKITLPNGNYYFNTIEDSAGCIINLNKANAINYTPIKYISSTDIYNCLTDSTDVQFSFEGQNPIHLVYNLNNQSIDSFKISSKASNWFTNGNYQWHYIADSLGCRDSIHSNLIIDNHPIGFHIDTITPNCMDKLYTVLLELQGKSPWELTYNNQNIPDSTLLFQSNSEWSIPSGSYYLNTLKDANNCLLDIKQSKSLPEFIHFTPVLGTNYKQLYVQENDLPHSWFRNSSLLETAFKPKIDIPGTGEYYVVLIDSAGCEYKTNSITLDYIETVSLFPNPAGNEVSLLVDDSFNEYWQYLITDAYGQKVAAATVTTNLITISIGHLQAGTYSVKISYQNENGIQNKVLRLVKI
jgi:hypothetical protein